MHQGEKKETKGRGWDKHLSHFFQRKQTKTNEMSKEEKKILLDRDYKTWQQEKSGQYFLLVVYTEDDGTAATVLIDIPLAMRNEGLTERVWAWLCGNARSDPETAGPGSHWLNGIREDEESSACLHFEYATPLPASVVMLHVRANCI